MESLRLADDEPLRVVIAEGQGLVRAAFRVLLEQKGMVVTAEAATAGEAVRAARATAPDVVLMDLDLPRPAAWRRREGSSRRCRMGRPAW